MTIKKILMRVVLLTVVSQHSSSGLASELNPVSRFVVSHTALAETPLSLRKSVTGTIVGAQVDRFSFALSQHQFAAVRLDQIDQDMVMVLFDPDGRAVDIIDRNNAHESEIATFVAPKAGRYVVQVAVFAWRTANTRYAIEVTRREALAKSPTLRAEQLVRSWYDPNSPGAGIAVMKGGKPVYKRTIGLATLEDRLPVTSATRFEIASVSKQFTGLAIAMLIEKGLISREQDIRTILPEVPDFGTPITIGHLLDHTSGLRDWDAPFALAGRRVEEGIDAQQVLALVARQKELNFRPGSEQAYSNTGYVLLGLIVGRVTHMTPSAWMQNNLFTPLGMSRSLLNEDFHAVISQKASSYEGRAPQPHLVSGNPSAVGGSSSVLSSLDDLLIWVRYLEELPATDPRLHAILTKSGTLADGTTLTYAYGNWFKNRYDRPAISHLGLAAGFRSEITRYKSPDVSVIFLTNDGDDATYDRAATLAKLFLGYADPPFEAPSDEASEAASEYLAQNLQDFVGTYLSPELGIAYHITADAHGVIASTILNGQVLLKPVAKDDFQSDLWYLPSVTFSRDDKGAISDMLVSTDTARHMRFARIR